MAGAMRMFRDRPAGGTDSKIRTSGHLWMPTWQTLRHWIEADERLGGPRAATRERRVFRTAATRVSAPRNARERSRHRKTTVDAFMGHTHLMGLFDRFRARSPHDPEMAGADEGGFRLASASKGRASLTLDLGDVPTDVVVEEAGEEPNGAFWEGVTAYLAPTVASRLEMDSEGSMFAAEGHRADLEQVRELLMPLVQEPEAMQDLLRRAQVDGVTLEGYGQ